MIILCKEYLDTNKREWSGGNKKARKEAVDMATAFSELIFNMKIGWGWQTQVYQDIARKAEKDMRDRKTSTKIITAVVNW